MTLQWNHTIISIIYWSH